MSLLEVDDIQVRYGAITAIHGLTFHVEEGEVVALLGANGAGNDTTHQTISGTLPPTSVEYRSSERGINAPPSHPRPLLWCSSLARPGSHSRPTHPYAPPVCSGVTHPDLRTCWRSGVRPPPRRGV